MMGVEVPIPLDFARDRLVPVDMRALDGYARAHHGLVTRDVARATAGASRSAWYRAIERGDLIDVRPNVARLPGVAPTRSQEILAVVLSLQLSKNPPALVLASHRSAAYLLGLDRPSDDPIDVIVELPHARSLPGVVVHRTTNHHDLTPTYRDGIACTNELRTLVDLGAVDPGAVAAALDRFAITRRITPATLWQLLARHSQRGRAGVAALRAAVEAWPLADDVPDSELELAMARLLRSAGLPPARFHARIAGYEVDFLLEGTPIVIECDGWTFHVADTRNWERDLDRDAALHAAGYIVLRRSRRQILYRPDETADTIRALLSRWSTGFDPP